MKDAFIQQESVKFDNLIAFYTVKRNKVQPKYCLESPFKKLIVQFETHKNTGETHSLFKDVASLLFIDENIVIRVLNIFAKAVLDLVKS